MHGNKPIAQSIPNLRALKAGNEITESAFLHQLSKYPKKEQEYY